MKTLSLSLIALALILFAVAILEDDGHAAQYFLMALFFLIPVSLMCSERIPAQQVAQNTPIIPQRHPHDMHENHLDKRRNNHE